MLLVAMLGLDDLDELDLVELMNANHAASADARRTGFRAEARAVGAVINGELLLRQNFFAMDVGDRRLRGGQQVELAERAGILTLPDGVGLVDELGELADTGHAIPANNVGWRNFRITMFSRVQFEQKLNQRALQLCAPIGVKQEAAAG